MEPLYRIEEQSTTGWSDWDETKPSMSKDQCQALYKRLINDGINPDDLKVVRVS